MPKPIDADLVKATLRDFRGDWDWEKGPLRLPLRRYSSTEQMPSLDAMVPVTQEYAEYRFEAGTVYGERAGRIVGTVPGTDLFVVVEQRVYR